MPKKKSKGPSIGLSVTPDAIFNGVLANVLQNSTNQQADKLLGYLRSRNYGALLNWSAIPSPQMYDSASSYYGDAQIAALIKKYPFTEAHVPGIDPRGTAVKKFFSAEHRCRRYNLRARLKRRRFNVHTQIYEYARAYIEKTIGFAPDFTDIYSHCDFTGGASMGVSGNKTNFARKFYADRWTATPSAVPYALSALWQNETTRLSILKEHESGLVCYDREEFRLFISRRVDLVNCNNITFVPKTALTERSIAVEPLLNGYIQKGVDVHLRERLLARGIDLSSQQVNQFLSRTGSLGGYNPYCTIDLAAASDSLAIEVVKDLIPPAWYEFLSDIRAPCFSLDGKQYRYEKFCSMGNGFCFPLQTLIFASVCHAVGRLVNDCINDDFSVYGDDIIVRQNVALVVVEILGDLGFKTNRDKTFITGPFRESCGSDWYDGQDVRPVHYDKPITEIRELFSLHNSMRMSERCENFFSEVTSYLRTLVPKPLLRPGREPGDTAFSVPLDVYMGSTSSIGWNLDYQNWQWEELISLPVADKLECLGRVEHAKALMYVALRGASSAMPFSVRYMSRPKIIRVSRHFHDGYTRGPEGIPAVKHVAHARNVIRSLARSNAFQN